MTKTTLSTSPSQAKIKKVKKKKKEKIDTIKKDDKVTSDLALPKSGKGETDSCKEHKHKKLKKKKKHTKHNLELKDSLEMSPKKKKLKKNKKDKKQNKEDVANHTKSLVTTKHESDAKEINTKVEKDKKGLKRKRDEKNTQNSSTELNLQSPAKNLQESGEQPHKKRKKNKESKKNKTEKNEGQLVVSKEDNNSTTESKKDRKSKVKGEKKKRKHKKKSKKKSVDENSKDLNVSSNKFTPFVKKSSVNPKESSEKIGKFSLFISQISPETDEETLKQFLGAKAVELAKTKKGISRGVGFATVRAKALDNVMKKNGETLCGCNIKIEHTDFSRKLMVRNLNQAVDSEHLRGVFNDCVAARVAMDSHTGKCKGYGFVEFNNHEDAKKALLQKYNFKFSGNRLMKITMDTRDNNAQDKTENTPTKHSLFMNSAETPKSKINGNGEMFNGADDEEQCSKEKKDIHLAQLKLSKTLKVLDVPRDTSARDLAKAMPYALCVRMPRFIDSGHHRGYGFVEFKSYQKLKKTLKNSVDKRVNGVPLRLERTLPLGKDRYEYGRWRTALKGSVTNTLQVRNLAYDTTADDLKVLFPTANDIQMVRHCNSGITRGYAIIKFRTAEAARIARSTVHESDFMGRKVFVQYAALLKKQWLIYDRSEKESFLKSTRLRINNIPPNYPTQNIYKFFKIAKAIRVTDPLKGVAYIDFDRIDDALDVMKTFQGKLIGRQKMTIRQVLDTQDINDIPIT